jgi:hypothetical protein
VVHSTVTVPPRQARRWKIQVDANNQDNAVLEGTFLSRGMMGGKIHVLVEDQTAKKALFDSKPTVKGKIHLKLQGGTYVLVISNEDSHVFSRTVKADVFVQSVQ